MKTEKPNERTVHCQEYRTAEETAGHIDKESPNRPKRTRKSTGKIEAAAAFPGHVDFHGEFENDRRFLDDVIGRVHQAVRTGDLELKTEHAFKAIEIKQKLSENSQVENLLLDLLNEIRRQELTRLTDSSFSDKFSE